MTDAELAAMLAEGAGRIALAIRDSGVLHGAALGIAGDKLANQFILAGIAEHRPGDGLLSEESIDTTDRLTLDRVWIVDPLDGTREYMEGRADWAVHVALTVAGRPVAGAVALPAQQVLLRSDDPPRPPERPNAPLRLLVSRTRPPEIASSVAGWLGAELVSMGSAGAKAAAVLTGRGDIYLHSGGQHEWDNCAPAAVAIAGGFNATRLDGSPLVYNQADTNLPDLLICSIDLAEKVRGLLG